MELASIPIAGYVTIAGAAVVVLALVVYLVGVIAVLRDVDKQLGSVTDAVLTIISQTRPVELVVTAIANDLTVGRGVLVGLLEKKVGAAAARSAMANALGPAAPAAEAPAPAPGDYPSSAPGKISYSRTSEFPAAAAPAAAPAPAAPAAAAPAAEERISYSRTTEFPSAAAPPPAPAAPAAPAAAPPDPDEPARIVYRRTIG